MLLLWPWIPFDATAEPCSDDAAADDDTAADDDDDDDDNSVLCVSYASTELECKWYDDAFGWAVNCADCSRIELDVIVDMHVADAIAVNRPSIGDTGSIKPFFRTESSVFISDAWFHTKQTKTNARLR